MSLRRQRGQALIYGIFLMIGGLAALFFLFNTGELTREKTKLVNTADAVAYSAGVMHARALNFQAYTNRAMIANTVAIAQLVSLASWVQYVDTLASFGIVLYNPKFTPYYPSFMAAMEVGPALKETLIDAAVLQDLAGTSDDIISVLKGAQGVAYAGLLPARLLVMNEVARANYVGDGHVSIDPVSLTVNEFTHFVSRYKDDKRTRFAQVTETSAMRDGFVEGRSWLLPGLWSDCAGATATGRVDWLDRRGGTELIGFDEWKARDTLSEKRWVPKGKHDVLCRAIAETPAGWGAQTAADQPSSDLNPTHYDSSMLVNPGSTALAIATESSSWDYSGLPAFYDLSESALDQDDPRLQFAIRLTRSIDQTTTSEGRSQMPSTPRLNDYQATAATGVLAAVSASEVFFERPENFRENDYGKSLDRPREIGSLFNPYWQVRLIHLPERVRAAQLLQGAVLP